MASLAFGFRLIALVYLLMDDAGFNLMIETQARNTRGMHFAYRRELTLSVRLHHISNGGLSSRNPGTDMVGIELSYALGR